MGCGPSSPDGKPIIVNQPTNVNDVNGRLANGTSKPDTVTSQTSTNQNGRVNNSKGNTAHSDNRASLNNKSEIGYNKSDKPPVPATKAITFDVTLDANANTISFDTRKLPSHLKSKLAPLENAPRLTADMLAERQSQVEQNRLKELEKKKEISRQSSRLRSRIIQAKEFDQQQYRQKEAKEIEEKQVSAGKNREARLAAHEEKKRLREERARRVKARAEQLKQAEEADLGYELEKDDAFNDDDIDSWLGDDDDPRELHTDMAERLFSASASTGRGASGTQRVTSQPERVTSGTDRVSSGTERVYSGRESPTKRANARSSAEMRARMSASTTDSHDFAFQRPPPAPIKQPIQDDFFD